MLCSEIIHYLECAWPVNYACDWDNVGLLAGRKYKEVKKIYVALEITENIIEEAINGGYDMIITHHPLIFNEIKKINDDELTGRRLLKLIQSDIAYYAMHTNFDIGRGGMADIVAEKLEMSGCMPLEVTMESGGQTLGIGAVGELAEPVTIKELAALIKEKFEVPALTVYGCNEEQIVQRIAVCPGSGKSEIRYALAAKVPVLITGDIGHHEGSDAASEGLTVIDAGHYGLEYIFVEAVCSYLKKEFHDEIEVMGAAVRFPFQVM